MTKTMEMKTPRKSRGKAAGEPKPVPAMDAPADVETLTGGPNAGGAEPAFKVGDRFILPDDEPLEQQILRVAHHEAGHAVIISGALGVEAKARVWIDENGELQGVTKHRAAADWSPAQWACIGVAGVIGEALALYPDFDVAARPDRVHAGLNMTDAQTCGVPHISEAPDWTPTPMFVQAVETVTMLLRGPLREDWEEMALELIATL